MEVPADFFCHPNAIAYANFNEGLLSGKGVKAENSNKVTFTFIMILSVSHTYTYVNSQRCVS